VFEPYESEFSPADVSHVFFIVRSSQFNNTTLLQRQHTTSSTHLFLNIKRVIGGSGEPCICPLMSGAKPTHLYHHCIDMVYLVELCLSEQTGLFQNIIEFKMIFIVEID
jgi:hypothetical protein